MFGRAPLGREGLRSLTRFFSLNLVAKSPVTSAGFGSRVADESSQLPKGLYYRLLKSLEILAT